MRRTEWNSQNRGGTAQSPPVLFCYLQSRLLGFREIAKDRDLGLLRPRLPDPGVERCNPEQGGISGKIRRGKSGLERRQNWERGREKAIDEEGRSGARVRTRGGVAAGGLEPALGGADGLLRLFVDEVEEPRRGELVRLVDRRRRRRRPRVRRHGWMAGCGIAA